MITVKNQDFSKKIPSFPAKSVCRMVSHPLNKYLLHKTCTGDNKKLCSPGHGKQAPVSVQTQQIVCFAVTDAAYRRHREQTVRASVLFPLRAFDGICIIARFPVSVKTEICILVKKNLTLSGFCVIMKTRKHR